jgi:hypothetical protein
MTAGQVRCQLNIGVDEKAQCLDEGVGGQAGGDRMRVRSSYQAPTIILGGIMWSAGGPD